MRRLTAEQEARDMLERAGVEDAQAMTAGNLVEIANLINEVRRLRSLFSEADAEVLEGAQAMAVTMPESTGVDGTGAEVDVETILDMLREVLSDDRVREIKVDLTNGVRELPPEDGFRRYGPDGTTVIRIEIVRVPRSAAPRREQYRPGVYEYFGGAGCPPVVYFDGKEWTRPGWEVPMTLGEDRDDSLTIDPEKIGELLWEETR